MSDRSHNLLVNEIQQPGVHNAVFNAKIYDGIYYYTITVNAVQIQTKKCCSKINIFISYFKRVLIYSEIFLSSEGEFKSNFKISIKQQIISLYINSNSGRFYIKGLFFYKVKTFF